MCVCVRVVVLFAGKCSHHHRGGPHEGHLSIIPFLSGSRRIPHMPTSARGRDSVCVCVCAHVERPESVDKKLRYSLSTDAPITHRNQFQAVPLSRRLPATWISVSPGGMAADPALVMPPRKIKWFGQKEKGSSLLPPRRWRRRRQKDDFLTFPLTEATLLRFLLSFPDID